MHESIKIQRRLKIRRSARFRLAFFCERWLNTVQSRLNKVQSDIPGTKTIIYNKNCFLTRLCDSLESNKPGLLVEMHKEFGISGAYSKLGTGVQDGKIDQQIECQLNFSQWINWPRRFLGADSLLPCFPACSFAIDMKVEASSFGASQKMHVHHLLILASLAFCHVFESLGPSNQAVHFLFGVPKKGFPFLKSSNRKKVHYLEQRLSITISSNNGKCRFRKGSLLKMKASWWTLLQATWRALVPSAPLYFNLFDFVMVIHNLWQAFSSNILRESDGPPT